jgi:hypothetical protein
VGEESEQMLANGWEVVMKNCVIQNESGGKFSLSIPSGYLFNLIVMYLGIAEMVLSTRVTF